MPDSQYSSKTVKITLEIGQVVIPVSRVVMRHTIDELPYAEVWVQLDNRGVDNNGAQGVVDINLQKFRRLMQLFQEKILSEFRIEPNVRLHVLDPNGFNLTFNGFLGKPDFMIQEGQVNLVVGVCHAKSALQAWTGTIYNFIQPYVLPSFVDAYGDSASPDAQGANRSQSVSKRVLALMEYAMKAVDMVPNQNDRTEFDMLPVHLLNQQAMKLVKEVLQASELATSIDGMQDPEFDGSNLEEMLFDVIRGVPNFWAVLKELCQIFMFQINADWQGNLWLERIQTVDAPGDRLISVPLAQIRFSAADMFEIPLLQVIVVGGDNALYVFSGEVGSNQGEPSPVPVVVSAGQYAGRIADDGEVWAKMTCVAKYPPDVPRNAAGNFYILQAPSWVNSDAVLDAMYDQLNDGTDPDASKIENTGTSEANIRKALLAGHKPRIKLLQYMAEQMFKTLFLGGTMASVTIPFDVRPMVGRTYTVQDLDGKGLFVGFLRDVHHAVTISPDGGADASTTLIFTHIQVSGAKLKQLLPVTNPASTFLGDANVDKTYVDPDSITGKPRDSGVSTIPNNIA